MEDQAFRSLDYDVMRHVFDTHNTLGCFCDERIYREELTQRLRRAGIGSVGVEVPIRAEWKDFSKRYYLDLLLAGGAIYELKTSTGFVPIHRAQVLNYLMLLDLSHGKLLNFRSPSMEWEFVSTRLTSERRRDYKIDATRWRPLSDRCATLRRVLRGLLEDWGAFLEATLYQEALVWSLGGEAAVLRRIDFIHNDTLLGSQTMHFLTPDVAFKLTAFSGRLAEAELHWQRLLALTSIRALHWVNFHQSSIRLITLSRS